MKTENFSIENSTKTFNDKIEKVNNLKNTIEKEISKVDNLYEKVNKETTMSYELKHEKLLKEEKDLKEKLQNEVTKVKEKLEKSLSEVNNIIKICEKINKGIKILEKEDKNMVKTLAYISKINKSQKEMKVLFSELMRNIKISFVEEESNIKCEEYFFNGIQTPKDIEFKEIGSNSFKIFWKIDDINILNINKNQINFRVEIKKENSNEKFVQIYEGNNNNCLADKLNKNTNYEIRICSVYNDLISNWTEIKKVKTKDYISIILNESQRENEFLQKIYEWSGYKRMELIYRATRDGATAKDFHNKCNNQGPTICLFKNDKGNIFGGYASISWENGNDDYHSAPDSFLFTLTNIHGTQPTKFPNTNSSYSLRFNSNYGPIFGGGQDIYTCSNFINDNSASGFPHSYQDNLSKGYSIFSGNSNSQKYKLKELEVFKLFK